MHLLNFNLFLKFGRIFVLWGQNNWELFGLFGCKFCNFFGKIHQTFKTTKLENKIKIKGEREKPLLRNKRNHQQFFLMKIIEQKKVVTPGKKKQTQVADF